MNENTAEQILNFFSGLVAAEEEGVTVAGMLAWSADDAAVLASIAYVRAVVASDFADDDPPAAAALDRVLARLRTPAAEGGPGVIAAA